MSPAQSIRIGSLKENELPEADRIFRLAFGTYLNLPDPLAFAGDRDFLRSRWRSPHTRLLAAREGGRLIGSNVLTRWGSFAFFGPLTVLPDYWNRGVALRLLRATAAVFDRWGVRRSGLFTFPHSARHVGLYQKFGYWPQYLTALMTHIPESAAHGGTGSGERFDQLLAACDAFAAARGVAIEAGVNLAREDAFRRMRAHGYRAGVQGVAMQRPHAPGFNRADAYVMDDWR